MESPSAFLRSPLFDFEGKEQKLKWGIFSLLLLSVVSIPLSVELQFTKTVRVQFPLELVAPATALFILAGFILIRNKPQFQLTDISTLLFIAVAGITTLFSVLPVISLKSFAVLAVYATTFYCATLFLSLRDAHWQLIWRVLLLSYSVLLLYTLFRYFNLGIHRKHSYEMSLPFIPGHTLLIAIGFPAFLYSFNQLLQKINIKSNLLFALLFSFATAISFSRIYWVLLLFSSFVLIFHFVKKARRPLFLSAIVFAVVGSIAYHYIDMKRDREGAWNHPDDHNSLFVQIQSIFVWEKNESNIERGNRWKVAREIFKAHPFTGSGLNTYPEIYFWYKDYSGVEETNLSCVKMNSHQIYLGWLSEMGIPGFVSGIFLLLTFFITVMRLRNTPYFIFSLLLFLNFVFLGLIEDFTMLEKIMAVFWLSLAYIRYLAVKEN